MNLVEFSLNGQIILPIEIQRFLKLKAGDKILFSESDDGEIIISNASAKALDKVQKAFKGVAEILGTSSEDDIQDLVDEVRYGKK